MHIKICSVYSFHSENKNQRSLTTKSTIILSSIELTDLLYHYSQPHH